MLFYNRKITNNGKEKTNPHNGFRQTVIMYTVLFAVVCAIVFCWYFTAGRTLIWSHDGWTQHYTALVYFAQYWRSVIKGVLIEHRFTLPEWNFYIGEGNDILQSLHYYSFGDPFSLCSVFVPTRFMWFYYSTMIILRLYFSGIAFLCLCRYTQKNMGWYAMLAGTLAYVFCYWAIHNANRHPYFLNPMIYFPLVILGVEKIIKKERPYLFVTAVFLSAISNFYFFYMIVLLTVIYVVVRLILIYKKDFRSALQTVLRVAVPAVAGTLLAAVIVFPVCYAFLSDSRMGSQKTWHLFYPLSYYSGLPGTFFSTGGSYWLLMGFAAPVFIAVLLLFMRKRERLLLKILFGICGIIIVFPVFGQILNGMSYMSNRWSWALALLCAYTLAVMWHDLMHLKIRDAVKLLAGLVIYFFACLMLEYSRSISVFSCICIAFIFLFTILPFHQESVRQAAWHKKKSLVSLCLVIVGITCLSFYGNAYSEGNYAAQAVEIKDVKKEFNKNETNAVRKMAEADRVEDEYYRYSGRKLVKNANIIADISSTSFYWSLTNPNVVEYMRQLETTESETHNHRGYDDRTMPLALSSVRYFSVPDSDDAPVPYEFSYADSYKVNDNEYKIYRNEHPLPLGYTYDSVISQEEWESLSAVEKQEAMMQSVYLEEYDGRTTFDRNELTSRSVDYSLECNSSNVTQDGNRFIVIKSNASVTLEFLGIENSETYVVIHGLEYEGIPAYDLYFGDDKYDPLDLYTEEKWDEMSHEDQEANRRSALFWKEPFETTLSMKSSAGVSKNLDYNTKEYSWYNDRHDFSVNLDYSKDPLTSVEISFSGRGIYTYDSIEVVCQPFDKYESQIAALGSETLENVEIEADHVAGTVNVDDTSFLCLAIPYSKGWTAYVDGKEAVLYQANIKNMAIELDAGEHEIELVYHCPLLRAGTVISLLTLIGGTVYIVYAESDLKKKQKYGTRRDRRRKAGGSR